jgi:hypothetical protein
VSTHHRWTTYYWVFAKAVGKECYKTWRGELFASLVSAGFIYLMNRKSVDVRMALMAAAYTMALFVIWHSLHIPWLLYKRFGESEALKRVWGYIGLFAMSAVISLTFYTAAWFYTMQPRIDLSKRPDGRDVRITQLRQEIDNLKEPEAPDSLRRRTAKAADDLYKYLIKRTEGRPLPDAWPNSSEPDPPPERREAIKRSQNYARETEDYYMKHFKDRMVGIIKEYESIGVPTRYLENDFKQRIPGIAEAGSVWEGMDDLSRFRELAYRVDAKNHLIVF